MTVMSISDANHAGISKLVSSAEDGTPVTVSRHGKPVAVVVSAEELEQLQRDRESFQDAALVLTRMATDTGARTDLDEAMGYFGIDRAELEAEIDAGLHAL